MLNKIGELTVDLKLNIDQRTAVVALHIVELETSETPTRGRTTSGPS